jgi:hypothetical protein
MECGTCPARALLLHRDWSGRAKSDAPLPAVATRAEGHSAKEAGIPERCVSLGVSFVTLPASTASVALEGQIDQANRSRNGSAVVAGAVPGGTASACGEPRRGAIPSIGSGAAPCIAVALAATGGGPDPDRFPMHFCDLRGFLAGGMGVTD